MKKELIKLFKGYKKEMKQKEEWYKNNVSKKLFSGRDIREEVEDKMHGLAIKLIEKSNFNVEKDRTADKGMLYIRDETRYGKKLTTKKLTYRRFRCHTDYHFNIVARDYDLDSDRTYEIRELKGVLPKSFTRMAYIVGKKINEIEKKKNKISNTKVEVPFKKTFYKFDDYCEDIKEIKIKAIHIGKRVSLEKDNGSFYGGDYEDEWDILCDEEIFEIIKNNIDKLMEKNKEKVAEVERLYNNIINMIEVDYKKVMATEELKGAI